MNLLFRITFHALVSLLGIYSSFLSKSNFINNSAKLNYLQAPIAVFVALVALSTSGMVSHTEFYPSRFSGVFKVTPETCDFVNFCNND